MMKTMTKMMRTMTMMMKTMTTMTRCHLVMGRRDDVPFAGEGNSIIVNIILNNIFIFISIFIIISSFNV